jgi:hypothetical protein
MGKVTRITLVTTNEGAEREFDLDHAERILAMRKSGWEIPKNSEYKYENGSISRRDKKKDK